MQRLEIGSGNNPKDGYLHLDINPDAKCVEVVADIQKKLPFNDNIFDEVIAHHVLEHVLWAKGEHVIKEIHRILVPGGTVDIALPNLTYVIEVWHDNNNKWMKTAGKQPFNAATDKWEYINHVLYGTDARFNNHKACYTFEALAVRLERNGFHKIKRLNQGSVQHLRVMGTKR